jgi:uncharacterized tellurite resistance protein B-like protein
LTGQIESLEMLLDDIHRVAPAFYGISLVPKESWREYGFALLTIAGSDGDVSDPELEWLTIGLAQSNGVDDSIVADWEEFEYEDADLKEIFAGINAKSFASYSRLLIYDAIRMSYADDDYAEEEKEKVYEASALLKVNRETVTAIESLIEMERAADKLRMIIL